MLMPIAIRYENYLIRIRRMRTTVTRIAATVTVRIRSRDNGYSEVTNRRRNAIGNLQTDRIVSRRYAADRYRSCHGTVRVNDICDGDSERWIWCCYSQVAGRIVD